ATLTMSGGFAASDSKCHPVTVNNRAPSDSFLPAAAPHSYYFHFSDFAGDLDGTVVSWSWNFGDGSTGTGRFPHHLYSDEGDFLVCLTVMDDDGATATYCKVVHVSPEQLPDTDLDGIWDDADNCPSVDNHDQADKDNDGIGNACDEDYVPDGTEDAVPGAHTVHSAVDTDHDGLDDAADNCRIVSNHDQADLDGDEQGDACDADVDGDGVPEMSSDPDAILDNCPITNNADQSDADGDLVGDACDDSPSLLGVGDKVEQADAARGDVANDATPAVGATGLAGFLADPARAALVGLIGLGIVLASVGLVLWSFRRWKK
ncbi:MAG TPA: thrombospondin type 3 repeat-containing protein, partial [Candidatus Thermoplasmatota archaeon]|nr:thrombospondin type 3 repeat-containing protein [Candidatus Thermoplasmatota archaeon]